MTVVHNILNSGTVAVNSDLITIESDLLIAA